MELNKEIDVIATFTGRGNLMPRKFRLINEDGDPEIYLVDRVLTVARSKGRMVFECFTSYHGRKLTYQLCYLENDMSWKILCAS